ncbi:MAG: hypothetical protein ACYCT0_09730 [Sulfobacillus sp.]
MARLWPFAKIPSTGSHERLHQGPQSDPLGFPQITVLAKSDVIDCKPNMVVLLEVVCEHGRATIIAFLIIVERTKIEDDSDRVQSRGALVQVV